MLTLLGIFTLTLLSFLPHKSLVHASPSCWSNTPCTGPLQPAFSGEWESNNFSPSSRTISPSLILSSTTSSSSLPFTFPRTLNSSMTIFDFQKEVAGIVSITYSASTGSGTMGVAFSEARNWTGENSDSSNGSFNPDGALLIPVTASSTPQNWTMPISKLRGGFRYLTIFTKPSSPSQAPPSITIHSLTLAISFAPSWPNLQAYRGYFHSSDALLNKIWYAGAYTLQTNAIPSDTGREFPILGSGWKNDADLSIGRAGKGTVYVDGSKRDRTVWPGDLAIAVPSLLVSTGDWEGVRGTLDVLFADQASSGELPFAAPAINIYGSDTYHMATLLGVYSYFLWTNDTSWLQSIYNSRFKRAMSFITSKIDDSGMLFVTGTNDWGRLNQGGRNSEANMLLYKTLVNGARIAGWMGDRAQGDIWSGMAQRLREAVNRLNFDSGAGAYKDSDTDSSIHPQDANSMSLLFSLAPPSQRLNISTSLTRNWVSIGAVAPELPRNIIGFGSSFEIKGHLAAHQAYRALDLIRRSWGWYLSHPSGTGSTCIEGYLSDGTFGYRDSTGYAYDSSYTSHAHGWSTGPTDALTSYIAGLTVEEPGGAKWRFEPQYADLQFAEAGFSTPLGQFAVSWRLIAGGAVVLTWGCPVGTVGELVLPVSAKGLPQIVEGSTGERSILTNGVYDKAAGTVTYRVVGNHSVTVVY